MRLVGINWIRMDSTDEGSLWPLWGDWWIHADGRERPLFDQGQHWGQWRQPLCQLTAPAGSSAVRCAGFASAWTVSMGGVSSTQGLVGDRGKADEISLFCSSGRCRAFSSLLPSPAKPGTWTSCSSWGTWRRTTWQLWPSGARAAASINTCTSRRPSSRCSSWLTLPGRRLREWSEWMAWRVENLGSKDQLVPKSEPRLGKAKPVKWLLWYFCTAGNEPVCWAKGTRNSGLLPKLRLPP